MMHSSACDCEASLCETLRGFSAQHPDSVIYQTSLMSALLSGVYEGETTIADLLAHRFENEDLHGHGTDEEHGADQVKEDDQLMVHGRDPAPNENVYH